MRREANLFIFSIVVCCVYSQAQDDLRVLNDLLKKDADMVGPGVMARLTPRGTSYVASVVARALTREIPLAKMPNEPRTRQLPSLPTVQLSGMHLLLFETPTNFNVVPKFPNLVSVDIRNIKLSMAMQGRGQVGTTFVNGPLELRTNQFSMAVNIKVGRNSRGNPHLEVDSCKVPTQLPMTLPRQNHLNSESGTKLMDAFMKDGSAIFEQHICSRLKFIMDTRINQRFNLMSSKIPLGETKNFDLVRSLTKTKNDNNFPANLRRDSPLTKSAAPRPRPPAAPRDPVTQQPPTAARHHHTSSSRRQGIQQVMTRPQMSRAQSRRPQWNRMQSRSRTANATQSSRMPRASAGALHTGEVKGPQAQTDESTLERKRVQRQDNMHAFLNSFNMSRADSLILNFGLLAAPRVTHQGIEMMTVGEIAVPNGRTPFGPRALSLPMAPSNEMLQIVVSDYVPNTLMYHGHSTGVFNTRVDPSTPHFGSVMRTTCDLSTGSLFCVGDIFPTLRDRVPNKGVAFIFSTIKAPSIAVRPTNKGGILFQMVGLIEILAVEAHGDVPIGAMEIHLDATMKMRLSSKAVRGKVNLESIKLISRAPAILVQEELDDAGFLSREILQRMVNDILKQGIPIPVHPLFKLIRPKLTLLDRSMLLQTNFQLNKNLISQLTAEKLVAV